MIIRRLSLCALLGILATFQTTAQTRVDIRSQSNWPQLFPPANNDGDVLRWNAQLNRWEGASSVASFVGRTGSVTPQPGDYSAAQVTNAVDQTQSYVNPSWLTSLSWDKITGAPSLLGGVTGTANQLVSSGTIISIANPFIFPGAATFAPASSSAPSFNIPQGIAPLSPSSGGFWATNNTLWWHNGIRPVALLNDDGAGNLGIPGNIVTGTAGGAAGSIVALRGTGNARVAVQGSSSGEWGITPAADFTSWDFTPPLSPCGLHQWWTTDLNGVGSCTQPSFADLSGSIQLGGTVGGDLSGSLPTPKVAAVNGTTVPPNSAADQLILTTASGAGSWKSIPSCADSSGNHLNYDSTLHSFSCGNSSSGSGTGAVTHTTGTLTANVPLIGNGGADIKTGSATGNTTTFVTSTGTHSAGNCAQWDANGNVVDAGSPCGTGGGGGGTSGTVLIGGSMGITSVSASATLGYTPFGAQTSSTSFAAEWSSPVAGNLGNLYVTIRVGAVQPASGSVTCTIYKNQTASSLGIVIPAGYSSPASTPAYLSDTSHTVSIAIGDSIGLRCQNSAATSSITLISWGASIQ